MSGISVPKNRRAVSPVRCCKAASVRPIAQPSARGVRPSIRPAARRRGGEGGGTPPPQVGHVVLGHGSGGLLTHRMIRDVFLDAFDNPALRRGDDAAVLALEKPGRLALTTDAHIVSPLFFPGGDIGRLAICGTVNDLAVLGAQPAWRSPTVGTSAGRWRGLGTPSSSRVRWETTAWLSWRHAVSSASPSKSSPTWLPSTAWSRRFLPREPRFTCCGAPPPAG